MFCARVLQSLLIFPFMKNFGVIMTKRHVKVDVNWFNSIILLEGTERNAASPSIKCLWKHSTSNLHLCQAKESSVRTCILYVEPSKNNTEKTDYLSQSAFQLLSNLIYVRFFLFKALQHNIKLITKKKILLTSLLSASQYLCGIPTFTKQHFLPFWGSY